MKFLFLPDGEDPDTYIRQIGKEKFESKVNQSMGFTQFLFGNLEAGLDSSSIEGKAALSKLAVPLISELPEGVFKQLVIKELAERTGLERDKLITTTGLDRFSGFGRTARTETSVTVPGRQLRFSKLTEYSLQLLIRRPTVATSVTDDAISTLDGWPEAQILVDLVRWVKQAGETSTLLLLSHYEETPYFDYFKQLAEQDPMLALDQLQNEFLDTINKMLVEADSQQKQKVIDELATKPLSELTVLERKMLQNYRKN